jgi:hypothetical protein
MPQSLPTALQRQLKDALFGAKLMLHHDRNEEIQRFETDSLDSGDYFYRKWLSDHRNSTKPYT